MKIAVGSLCLVAVSSFTVRSPPRVIVVRPSLTTLASEKAGDDGKDNVNDDNDEKDGGLDLDLGEMFEMFEAADKDASFDDAIKKVKGD